MPKLTVCAAGYNYIWRHLYGNHRIHTPTHIYFGREAEKLAGKVMKLNGAKKVLLHSGTGSVSHNGLTNMGCESTGDWA